MDDQVAAALRDATQRDDGPAWATAARALLRLDRQEEAARAARRALARGTAAMDVLDATTPELDHLSYRASRWAEPGDQVQTSPRTRVVWDPRGDGRALVAAAPARGQGPVWSVGLDRGVELLPWSARNLIAAADDGPLVLVATTKGVVARDPAAPAAGTPIPVGSGHVRSLAVRAAPRRAVVVDDAQARVLDLERGTPLLELPCEQGGVDPSGALALATGSTLALHDPLVGTPRAVVKLQAPPRYVVAVGTRALVAYDHRLVLHGEDGAVLGTCAVHAGVTGPTRVKPGQFDPLATAHHVRPCASGRLVAYGESLVSSRGTEHKLLVADLRTGKAHAYGAPGVVVDVLWSPSGRSVHAVLEQRDGALRVLVVEVERAAPSP